MRFFKIHKYFPKQVYSTFFPVYLVSTAFGLFPLCSKNNNGRREIFYSIFSIVRTVIYSVLYSLVFCYIMYKFDSITSVLCTIRFYQDVFSSLLYVCEIIAGCVFAKTIVEIFGNIDKTNEMLRHLKINISYKTMYVQIIICIMVVFLGIGAMLSLLISTESFLTCYCSRTHNILVEIISYCLPFIANVLMELQYFQYLNILRFRYEKINKYLLENTELIPSKIDFEHVSTITTVSPKPTKDKPNDSLYVINQVTKIHMILTDTARLANKVFCFQQLIKIAISFVSIITGLFLFAIVFAVKDPSKLPIDILFFVWVFSNALEIFVVVWISAETCKAANDCPIILHRIRNCSANEELKSLIDLHSLQMYHSKLSFSVCGLFPLDYSLLYSVVAGATTYLVILIQFNVDMVKAYDNQTTVNTYVDSETNHCG